MSLYANFTHSITQHNADLYSSETILLTQNERYYDITVT